MLTQAQVQRYANESGLRDIMIAEKEIVLTYLIQLLSERGILDRLAFKGGTCLRKIFLGAQGRFSTDLDFTGNEEHNHVLADLTKDEQLLAADKYQRERTVSERISGNLQLKPL